MRTRETVHCRNPDPDKRGMNIPRWKFDVIRGAILGVLAQNTAGVEFKRLSQLVRSHIPEHTVERLGSISWFTTVVKLHLETTAEIERIPGSKPQVVRSTTPPDRVTKGTE
jgi:hypothetical protein